jgi:predicted amidohydrolase YtcJ
MSGLLIRNVAVRGRAGLDVRVGRHAVIAVGRALPPEPGDTVFDGRGGALIPGLHDHHVHLRAAVAARESVDVSRVSSPAGFDRLVARAAREAAAAAAADRREPAWVRVIGWHEPATGPLTRTRLDAVTGQVPVRVQHRGGAMWVLNSAALDRVGAASCDLPGVERDERGEPTGRLLRLDAWLRTRLPDRRPAEFAAGLGRYAADCGRVGIAGWTDATPDRDQADVADFAGLADAGVFSQRLVLMAPAYRAPAVPPPGASLVTLGPVKVMLDDFTLPSPAELAGVIARAHATGAAVAVHCVTAGQLVVTVAAVAQAAPADQEKTGPDRIEHAGVVPPGYAAELARLGLAVVTQPGFIADRGDTYRREVDPPEHDWLYPAASLLRAGVTVAAGTDTPFGPGDPWRCIAAAVTRQAPDGEPLGPAECVSPRAALRMFLADPRDLRATRSVAPGQPADLCLLHCPLTEALTAPAATSVHAVITSGQLREIL